MFSYSRPTQDRSNELGRRSIPQIVQKLPRLQNWCASKMSHSSKGCKFFKNCIFRFHLAWGFQTIENKSIKCRQNQIGQLQNYVRPPMEWGAYGALESEPLGSSVVLCEITEHVFNMSLNLIWLKSELKSTRGSLLICRTVSWQRCPTCCRGSSVFPSDGRATCWWERATCRWPLQGRCTTQYVSVSFIPFQYFQPSSKFSSCRIVIGADIDQTFRKLSRL